MRIRVTGTSESALAVAKGLMDGGFVVDDEAFDYTVEINDTPGSQVVVDGINCPLELQVFNAIAMTADIGVFMDRPGPNRSDSYLSIRIPTSFSKEKRVAIEHGVRGGFENMLKPKTRPAPVGGMVVDVLPLAQAIKDVAKLIIEAESAKPRWWQVWR